MNKALKLSAAAALTLGLAACSGNGGTEEKTPDSTGDETVTLVVGATTSPHGVILDKAKDILAEQGVNLEIKEFSEYKNINPSTSDGSLDANYFQHYPYLESYNNDNGYQSGDDGYLVSVGAIHYEPLGIYSNKYETVAEVPDGAQILIPNDPSNEARALLLLEDQGLITLDEDAALENATVRDIAENPKNLDIVELAADQIATKLEDADYVIVNGNYALSSDITDYLLETEASDSDASKTYQNIIAVKESRKDDPAVLKLVEVLKSDDIKNFITEEFGSFAYPAE